MIACWVPATQRRLVRATTGGFRARPIVRLEVCVKSAINNLSATMHWIVGGQMRQSAGPVPQHSLANLPADSVSR
jgi:hypothetical protein